MPHTGRHNLFRLWPGPLSNVHVPRECECVLCIRSTRSRLPIWKMNFYVRCFDCRQTDTTNRTASFEMSFDSNFFSFFSSSLECVRAIATTCYAINYNYSTLRCIGQVIVVFGFDPLIVYLFFFSGSFGRS